MPSKKKTPAKSQAARLMEVAKARGDNSEGKFAKQVGRITMANEARKATKMK